MVLKSIILTIFLMVSFAGSAQVNLNEYKYVVIPKKFDGFKKENQHQTSTLIKYLFDKNGFTTTYDDDFPLDLNSDRCLGLYVDMVNNSSMFTTKTALSLKDCNNQEVFITREGKSKKKNYKESFSEAINRAFESLSGLNYAYEPKATSSKKEEPFTISFRNDIKTVEDTNANQDAMVKQTATKDEQYYKDQRPVESKYKKAEISSEKKMIEQKTTKEDQSYKNLEPVQSDYTKEQPISVSKGKEYEGILYAQELSNGYQLIDSTPKIKLKIFKSSMPNVYIAKADERDGVVYASDGKWFFEYHEGNQIVKEELNIKF